VARTEPINQTTDAVLELLRRTDTCTISNAIETFNIRMRNEGFICAGTNCMFPELPPVAGYAVPGRIRTSAPPISNLCYYHRADWWTYVASLPSPKIIVLQDADPNPGTGAVAGEIHAQIAKSLGCVAYVTNGSIRDVQPLRKARFQCFASGTSVSHGYAHIIDFGEPVVVGGLKISPGDLLHGDEHGVHTVPVQIAERLPEAVHEIMAREAELLRFCRSPDFTLEKLISVLQEDSPACEPPHRL
jgi:4-hydroxy-4-methyl-2-oxoglutarate aldolase